MFLKEFEEIGFDSCCVSFRELGREQVAVSFAVLFGSWWIDSCGAASKSAFWFPLREPMLLLELPTCWPDLVKARVLSYRISPVFREYLFKDQLDLIK
jgi:hypothetical protein